MSRASWIDILHLILITCSALKLGVSLACSLGGHGVENQGTLYSLPKGLEKFYIAHQSVRFAL